MRSYAITFSELASAIARNSLLSTGGMVKTRSENLLIRAKNNGYVADDFRNIVVKSLPTGELIRLYQVAEVKDIWNESPNRIYYNGKSGVRIRISNTNNEDLYPQRIK